MLLFLHTIALPCIIPSLLCNHWSCVEGDGGFGVNDAVRLEKCGVPGLDSFGIGPHRVMLAGNAAW